MDDATAGGVANYSRPAAVLTSFRVPESAVKEADDGCAPNNDLVLLARAWQAELRSPGDLPLAWKAFSLAVGKTFSLALYSVLRRPPYRLIFSSNETIGILVAVLLKLLGKSTRHLVVSHNISNPFKAALVKYTHAQSHITWIIGYGVKQWEWCRRLGFSTRQIRIVFHGPDHEFWCPGGGMVAAEPPLILTAGMERRDYATLIKAVEELPVQVLIAAYSPWASRKLIRQSKLKVPPNVRFDSFTPIALREAYTRSRFVVVPLIPNSFHAGSLVVLEAMAMGKAVIISRSGGQVGLVEEGKTGLYVPCEDPVALREAIAYLLDHPQEAERMGREGRRRVERHLNQKRFLEKVVPLGWKDPVGA